MSSRLILKSRENALQSTADHPERLALENNVPQQLQSRTHWRSKIHELALALLGALQHRAPQTSYTIAPGILISLKNAPSITPSLALPTS